MPTPTSATNRLAAGGERSAARRRQRRAAAGRQRRRARRPRRSPAHERGLGGDVGRVALEQHPGGRAVPQDRRRPVEAAPQRRTGRAGRRRTTAATAGRGRVRRMTSPRNASVPSEPTSRRHRSKPLTFFTVGPPALTTSPSAVTHAGLEQRVAHRPVAEPAHAAAADGQHAADGARPASRAGRRTGRARPARRRSSATVVPAPQRTVISSGCDPLDAAGRPHHPGARIDRPADVPLRPAADAGDRARRRRPRRRRPSDPCAVRHALQVGAAAARPAAPCAGWPRRRDRRPAAGESWASRSAGGEQQRHEVPLLEADAVLAASARRRRRR